jgi:DNA invertase Pin-like site-specific DNA recombinase
MGRRFGYARVSSDGQDLTAQRDALRAAGCDIIREEKVSGGSTAGRKQLAILFDFIC